MAEAKAVKSGVMLLVEVTVPEVTNPATTIGSGKEDVSVRIISMVDVGRGVIIVVEVEESAELSSAGRTVDAAAEGMLEDNVELEGRVKKRRAAQVVMLSPCRRSARDVSVEMPYTDILAAVSCYWGAEIASFAVAVVEGATSLYLMSVKDDALVFWRATYFSKSWIITIARSKITTSDRPPTISLPASEEVTLDFGTTVFKVGSITILSEGEASEGRCEAQGNERLHFGKEIKCNEWEDQ